MSFLLPSFAIQCSSYDKAKVLLTSSMCLDHTRGTEVMVIMTEDSLVMKPNLFAETDGEKYFRVDFQFHIYFSVIRLPLKEPKKSKLGLSVGIIFGSVNCQEQIRLFIKENIRVLDKWVDLLRRRINKMGFEEEIFMTKEIGRGQSSKVYMAVMRDTMINVAVKMISKPASGSSYDRNMRAIENQIAIMRKLNHPNILRLIEVFITDTHYVLITEMCRGGTLADWRHKKTMSLGDLKKILKSILKGVHYMHSLDIIHRDLKPDNIFFRNLNDSEAIIGDFGLATNMHEPNYIFIRCGTPGFVAPEIIFHEGPTGQSKLCDIFSIGVIAHVLALGNSPFYHRTQEETLIMNQKATVDWANKVYSKLDPALLQFMVLSITKSPKVRMSSVQLLDHLLFKQTQKPIKKVEPCSLTNDVLEDESTADRSNKKLVIVIDDDQVKEIEQDEQSEFRRGCHKRSRKITKKVSVNPPK